MQKEWATAHFQVWVAAESSGSMSRQWVLCRDKIWSWQGFLSRNRSFPGHDIVFFSWFSITTGNSMSRQSLAKTKGPCATTQYFSVVTRSWPKAGISCCDWVLHVATVPCAR